MRKPVNLEQAINVLEKIKERKFDDVSSNFVIGMPGDTWDDIRESFNWVDKVVDKGLLDYVVFHIATPFPKTELYEICKREGCIPQDLAQDHQLRRAPSDRCVSIHTPTRQGPRLRHFCQTDKSSAEPRTS